MPITIVQGGQYGSEAKGAIAGYLCQKRNFDVAVRTGATNAGHTVYYKRNDEWVEVKLQQLPVGFVNPHTMLVVGAGALIDPAILEREVKMLSELTGTDIGERLMIDSRAGLHLSRHAEASRQSGRHYSMGATGKGCSEALVERIQGRGRGYVRFGNSEFAHGYNTCDTEAYLNFVHYEGGSIMLEGTQGQLLDLYLGPYPYTTHKQTGPAQWMLEAGLSPALNPEIVSVMRTFPIRVAGNSGPLPNEISWPELAIEINESRRRHGMENLVPDESIIAYQDALRKSATLFDLPSGSDGLDMHKWSETDREKYAFALSELPTTAWKALTPDIQTNLSRLFELTTVTKKLRRIGRWTRKTATIASRQMQPSWVALTFMNYWHPYRWFDPPADASSLTDSEARDIEGVSFDCGNVPVKLVSYGPRPDHILEL